MYWAVVEESPGWAELYLPEVPVSWDLKPAAWLSRDDVRVPVGGVRVSR
jgi:hypothetical protein